MRLEFSWDMAYQTMKQYMIAAAQLGMLICTVLCILIISAVCFAMLVITPIDTVIMPLAIAAFLAPFFVLASLAPLALSSGIGVALWAYFNNELSAETMQRDLVVIAGIAQVASLPILLPLLFQITGIFSMSVLSLFLPALIVTVAGAFRTDAWHETMYRRRKPKFSVID